MNLARASRGGSQRLARQPQHRDPPGRAALDGLTPDDVIAFLHHLEKIANISAVRAAVLDAHRRGDWQADWLLVTEYRRVDVLDVLIARSKNARAKVVAHGTHAAADVAVAEDAAFEIQTDDVFAVKNQKQATPLYGLRKLKGFLRPALKPISGGAAREDALSLEAADDEPFDLEMSAARRVPLR